MLRFCFSEQGMEEGAPPSKYYYTTTTTEPLLMAVGTTPEPLGTHRQRTRFVQNN